MKRLLFAGVILLAACSPDKEVESTETVATSGDYQVLAEQLQIPWSINKIDDTFYISERTGTIMKITNDKQSRQKVNLHKPLATAAEAGLLGFVLAPDFSESNKAFAYYTYKDDEGQFNRIITLKLDHDVWKEEETLLDKIPSGSYHHGGRLKLGPDGKLYATTGDAAENPEIAQDVNSLGGKILRLNLDGSIPEDNPFPKSYVYSYGHRNPQGLAWTEDGKMYASEHGPTAYDEINFIKKAGNYGWPALKGDETKAGLEAPLFHSGEDQTWAPSGMDYENGKLYVATLRGSAVRAFDLEAGTTQVFISGFGRIRDVLIEDGTLYLISNNTDGRGTPAEQDDRLYQVSLEDRPS